MPAYYTYLISSLPVLNFDMLPPFSFGSFLSKCEGLVSEKDLGVLSGLSLNEADETLFKTNMVKEWLFFEKALRNELAKIRVARKHESSEKYVRTDIGYDSYAAGIASAAARTRSVLDAEKSLDSARWKKLESLSEGHFFDFDFLVIYGYKLLILERWERVRSSDKKKLIEASLKESGLKQNAN